MKKIPVSVVVITRNEEENIAACLGSVPWADEIIVVDDNSSDATVKTARQFTDNVFSRKMDIEGIHRNYAYGLARNDWVLSLDADERASAELGKELAELFDPSSPSAPGKAGMAGHKAYTIPIKTFIARRWIRHGGWYPAPKVRLFEKKSFRYEEAEVHPRVFIQGSCGHLKNDIMHYSYRNFHDFFESLNNQTTLEARKWFNERRKISFFKMHRKVVDRFLKAYLLKGGCRDGLLGFVVCCGGGLYQFMSYVKYKEMLWNEKNKG